MIVFSLLSILLASGLPISSVSIPLRGLLSADRSPHAYAPKQKTRRQCPGFVLLSLNVQICLIALTFRMGSAKESWGGFTYGFPASKSLHGNGQRCTVLDNRAAVDAYLRFSARSEEHT